MTLAMNIGICQVRDDGGPLEEPREPCLKTPRNLVVGIKNWEHTSLWPTLPLPASLGLQGPADSMTGHRHRPKGSRPHFSIHNQLFYRIIKLPPLGCHADLNCDVTDSYHTPANAPTVGRGVGGSLHLHVQSSQMTSTSTLRAEA